MKKYASSLLFLIVVKPGIFVQVFAKIRKLTFHSEGLQPCFSTIMFFLVHSFHCHYKMRLANKIAIFFLLFFLCLSLLFFPALQLLCQICKGCTMLYARITLRKVFWCVRMGVIDSLSCENWSGNQMESHSKYWQWYVWAFIHFWMDSVNKCKEKRPWTAWSRSGLPEVGPGFSRRSMDLLSNMDSL